MLRRLFPFFAFLSLALCVGSIIFWIRSQQSAEMLIYTSGSGARYEVSSGQSGLRDGMRIGYDSTPYPGAAGGWDWEAKPLPHVGEEPPGIFDRPPKWRFAGFRYYSANRTLVEMKLDPDKQPVPTGRTFPFSTRFLVTPYWAVPILAGILPLVWLLSSTIRHRRLAAGLCPECGRALPGMGACGNCGFLPPMRG